jgi:protein-disulfide isomerase
LADVDKVLPLWHNFTIRWEGVVAKKKERKASDRQSQPSMINPPVILGIVFAAIVIAGVLIFADRQAARTVVIPDLLDYSLANENTLGNEDAPVTMIEYSDFQCPFCGQFHQESFPLILENYIKTGKVFFIYRHFTILGPPSFRAAKASLCANEQGSFWPYHDILFANQDETDPQAFSAPRLELFAENVGLDVDSFRECVIDDRMDSLIDEDYSMATEDGASTTPTFIINGKLVRGAQAYEVFETEIEAALSAPEESSSP